MQQKILLSKNVLEDSQQSLTVLLAIIGIYAVGTISTLYL